jgi:hypothetical protein
MKRISLSQGKHALVDDEDYESVSKYKWCAHITRKKYSYATRNVKVNGKYKTISMHRLIMLCPDNMQIDHINHNGLDNRKKNLRICKPRQNCMNRYKHQSSHRKYKGVWLHPNIDKWKAGICVNGKLINLGLFKTEKEAAKAYNRAAKKYFGEFAHLNKV